MFTMKYYEILKNTLVQQRSFLNINYTSSLRVCSMSRLGYTRIK